MSHSLRSAYWSFIARNNATSSWVLPSSHDAMMEGMMGCGSRNGGMVGTFFRAGMQDSAARWALPSQNRRCNRNRRRQVIIMLRQRLWMNVLMLARLAMVRITYSLMVGGGIGTR